jgi:putative NADPH-quinone reductase
MRALVTWAHPPGDELGRRLRDTTVAALTRAGHQVELADLYADEFEPVMGTEEWRAYRRMEPALDDRTRAYAAALARSEILVFGYPSRWLGVPALLKGFLDRVFVPGVAFHLDSTSHRVRPGLLHVRHLVVVTTHDAPRAQVAALRDAGRRTILRTLRLACGRRCRSTWLALYGAAAAGAADEAAFVARVDRALGRRRPAWITARLPSTNRRAAAVAGWRMASAGPGRPPAPTGPGGRR